MKSFMFSKTNPDGKVFSDDPRDDLPLCPKQGQMVDGVTWWDSPSYLKMTTDQVVEAIVKQELKKHSSDRFKLEAEHKKKYGYDPRHITPDKKVEAILDEPIVKRRTQK